MIQHGSRVVLGSYFQRSGSAQRSVSVNLRATTTFSALTSAQRSNLLIVIEWGAKRYCGINRECLQAEAPRAITTGGISVVASVTVSYYVDNTSCQLEVARNI